MNNLVTTEQIPDYEQIPLTNLHSDYKKVAQMNALIASVVGLTFLLGVFLIFDTTEEYYAIVALFLVFIFIIFYISICLRF